jgi:endogenous inhibitor of DNA gyrase (YacG/DUF329 family)
MGLSDIRCPVCKREVSADDPNMPFCSDRCRSIDLGNWATEKYVISKPNQPSEFEEASGFEDGEDGEPSQGPVR